MSGTLFLEDYPASRDAFNQAARHAGARLESVGHPAARAPDGTPLAIDVAKLGPTQATRVLVLSAGVHGLEGPAGAAILIDLLRRRPELPADVRLLLIHCVNPWGMAYGSRGNEDNIDLNRNLIDRDARSAPANLDYARWHSRLCDVGLDEALAVIDALFVNLASPDSARAIDAIYKGQYKFADGIGFGGHSLAWSNRVLIDVLSAASKGADVMLHVDWHTGMGAYGAVVPVSLHHKGSVQAQNLECWYGAPVCAFDSAFSSGSAPGFSGVIVGELASRMAPGRYHGLAVEFGTVDNRHVLRSFVIDQFLRRTRGTLEDADKLRAELQAAYCPADPDWERSVLGAGRQIVDRLIAALNQDD